MNGRGAPNNVHQLRPPPPAIEAKSCSRCGETKPLSEFNRSNHNKTGRRPECRDCQRSKAAGYREGNREKALAATNRSREQNRSYYRQWQSEYKKRNPEKIRAQRRRYIRTERGRLNNRLNSSLYRARARAAGGKFTAGEWLALLSLQRRRCYYCKTRFSNMRPATIEHLIPISAGGPHIASNIVAACKSCNSSKKAKRLVLL